MRSSRAYVSESERSMSCENDDCNFEGLVEVWSDYEIHACGWVCPDCHNEHSLDWEWEDDPDRYRD